MIYLKLFLTFLEIGAVSFGGGYGMISLIREKVLANGWMSEGDLMNMIAVSESTPGPIAVNMATFIGSNQAGILGSLVATLGVVLPSFVIILIIAALVSNLLKYKGTRFMLAGIRPCIVGLILATAIIMFCNKIFSAGKYDLKALAIFAILILVSFLVKRIFKKKISPIIMILFSALLGLVAYAPIF